jgi:hypothetical protein
MQRITQSFLETLHQSLSFPVRNPRNVFRLRAGYVPLEPQHIHQNTRPSHNKQPSAIAGLRSLNVYEDLAEVKNLALMMYPAQCRVLFLTTSPACMELEVAELPMLFRGVKKLALLYDHADRSETDHSPISFIELDDIGRVFQRGKGKRRVVGWS